MFPYCDYTTTIGSGLTLLAAALFGLAMLRLVIQAALAPACGRIAGAMLADMLLFCALVVLAYQAFTGAGFLARQVQDALYQLAAPFQQEVQALNDPAGLGF